MIVRRPSWFMSTLVKVIAWFRQAASRYLKQKWPRPMPPYGGAILQHVDMADSKILKSQVSFIH